LYNKFQIIPMVIPEAFSPEHGTETLDEPKGIQKRALSTMLTVAMAALYGGIMYYEHDPNPITAANTFTHSFGGKLGIDYCPDAPASSIEDAIVSQIDAAPLLSEDEILKRNDIDPGELTITTELIKRADSAQAATDILSDFTSRNMGFQTKLDIPDSIIETRFNLEAYKAELNSFASYTSLLPNGLLRKIDIPKVTFNDIFETSGYTIAALYQNTDTARPGIIMDVNFIQNAGVFIHEALGHGGQYESCQGVARNDRAMTQLNPTGFSYGIECGKPLKLPETVASYRAGANSSEDVAEQARLFVVEGSKADAYIHSDTPLGQKLKLTLSRWDSLSPGSPVLLADARPYLQILAAESSQTPAYTSVAHQQPVKPTC
jgi:hypothetical protein